MPGIGGGGGGPPAPRPMGGIGGGGGGGGGMVSCVLSLRLSWAFLVRRTRAVYVQDLTT